MTLVTINLRRLTKDGVDMYAVNAKAVSDEKLQADKCVILSRAVESNKTAWTLFDVIEAEQKRRQEFAD